MRPSTRLSLRFAAVALAAWVAAMDAASAQDNARKYQIAEQSLGQALREFALASNLDLLFSPNLVAGKKSPSLDGKFTVDEGLRTLLRGSGLEFSVSGSRVVISEVKEAPPRQAPSTTSSLSDTNGYTRFAQAEGAASKPPSAVESSVRSANLEDASQQRSELEEIVVTATKREERLKDVPISISVLSGADLDKSSASGVTEALSRIPGVVATMANQGGGTQVAIRGVGASGPLFNGSSPIAYYLDSVPFGLVASAIVPDPNPYDLERIEALRGPQGTLYGASAQNGVVRILTHDAGLDTYEAKARGLASSTAGGGGSYRADAAVNVPLIPGKLAVRTVAGYQDLSGWIDGPTRKDVNDGELRNYRVKLNAQPSDALSIGVSAWISRSELGGRSASNDDGTISSSADESIDTEYDLYGLEIGYKLASFSISSMTGYLDYQNTGAQGLDFFGLPALFTGLDARVLSQEVLLDSRLEGPWQWSLGAFYRDGEDRLRQNDLGGGIPFDYSRGSRSFAGFSELRRRFADDRLEWTLGVRYFHDDVSLEENINRGGPGTSPVNVSDTFTSTTPRAVLSWYPNRNLTGYASYSEGFRSGLHQDPAVSRDHSEIGPARPDKLRNYEIGTKADVLDGKLSFEGALYFMDWREVQQTISVATGGTFVTAVINGESASGMGIDLAATLRPSDRLELGFSVSWNDLTLDDEVVSGGTPLFASGDRLNLSSEYTAGAFIEYVFPIGGSGFKGQLATSANYISKQTDRGIFIGPFLTTGEDILTARASATLISPRRWTASLFADNINDEYGAMPAVLPVVDWSPRTRPRTVGVQIDYAF